MVRWLLLLAACKPHEVEQKPVEPERPIDAAIDALVPDARVKVVPPATPVRLAEGDAACAIMSDATVRCADGAPDVRAVKSLATADGTACALLDDGSVSCWGKIGWSGKTAVTPTGVLGVTGVTKLWVRPHLGCGQVANGLICWGAIDPQGHPAISGMRQPTPAVDVACEPPPPPPKPSKKKPKKPPPPPPPPKECGTAIEYVERVPVPSAKCALTGGELRC